jgi:hypothetical protein
MGPRFGTLRETDTHEGTVYQLVITDRQGELIFAVGATSVNEMWKRLEMTYTAQLQRLIREQQKKR